MAIKQYYIPLVFDKTINYLYFLRLYRLATYNQEEKAYNKIFYDSYKKLSLSLNISESTLKRFLSNGISKNLFTVDSKNKVIMINNIFRKSSSREVHGSFVVLTDKEVNYFIQQNDDLLLKYYLYLKWNCGKWNYKNTNFTANQFLSTIGLSISSGSNKTKISGYNKKLLTAGFIYIQKWVDEQGRIRNNYSIQQPKNTAGQIDCGNASNLSTFIF